MYCSADDNKYLALKNFNTYHPFNGSKANKNDIEFT